MRVLIDTSVLSLALRRSRPELFSEADRVRLNAFSNLAKVKAAVTIGAIRQEILSGLKSEAQYEKILIVLQTFVYLPTDLADHDAAAKAFNQCRARGIAAGPIDMLLCATAMRHGLPIFTVDADFSKYATVIPVRRFEPVL